MAKINSLKLFAFFQQKLKITGIMCKKFTH